MKFLVSGEPFGKRYRMVKEGLADESRQYLMSVLEVTRKPCLGADNRKNEEAYMSIAAMYLLQNKIDEEMVYLLSRRMVACKEIGKIKHTTRSPIYVPEREAEILDKKDKESIERGLPSGLIREVFTQIMAESRRLQQLEWDCLDALVSS